MPKNARNTPDEFKTKLSRTKLSGGDDVEGHLMKTRVAPDEFKTKLSRTKLSGGDDVEGHLMKTRITPGEGVGTRNDGDGFKTKLSRTKVSGEDDVEGHWMSDTDSSMRIQKARNSEIERGSRQHQLESDARRAKAEAKRTHTKG